MHGVPEAQELLCEQWGNIERPQGPRRDSELGKKDHMHSKGTSHLQATTNKTNTSVEKNIKNIEESGPNFCHVKVSATSACMLGRRMGGESFC